MPITADSLKAEAARIEQAYSRRKKAELYSRFNSAYLFMVQEHEQRLLALLVATDVFLWTPKEFWKLAVSAAICSAILASGEPDQKTLSA